jgi:hypothetical protein
MVGSYLRSARCSYTLSAQRKGGTCLTAWGSLIEFHSTSGMVPYFVHSVHKTPISGRCIAYPWSPLNKFLGLKQCGRIEKLGLQEFHVISHYAVVSRCVGHRSHQQPPILCIPVDRGSRTILTKLRASSYTQMAHSLLRTYKVHKLGGSWLGICRSSNDPR